MTAYGALLSLRNTIKDLLLCPRFSLVGRSKKIIHVVCTELDPLQQILERLDGTSPCKSRKKVNALDGIIKEAIWRFEDSLESLLTHHIPSQSQTIPEIVSIDLQSLQNDANSLIHTLNDMKEEYIYEVENMAEDEPISSSIGFHGSNSKMIGLSDKFRRVKTQLMLEGYGRIHFHALYGTEGIGKTALAMQIYQDPQIQSKFECRAWVTLGRVPQPLNQISLGILAQLCGLTQGDEEISVDFLTERLYGKKCLIVLDDLWDTDAWDCLEHSLPYIKTGCIQVLLTSRHRKLMEAYVFIHYWYEMRFLKEDESMDLLCEKVFGDGSCPPQLHKSATKIAKLCEGLPLLIVTVADILSKSEKNRDPAYWKEVAEKINSVFTDAYDEISKVLFPSYDYLPQCLKMPLLFMGVFPQDYDTKISKIIIMLTAEGLWYDSECLRDLAIYYSLVLRNLKSMYKTYSGLSTSEYKTCRLHSSWRHVCRGEASKNKFYCVLNKLIDAEEEGLQGQRGLCLENNILFCIEKFCDSVRLNCASSARSLLLYGPYHQYPIPIDVGFMLLREIDALTQRFYTFPIEILSLVQLKYLALTCNGELPSTISKLFNLRVLIIHPHMSIRRCGAPLYVPVQIWDMRDLEHIEILGKSLLCPSHVASLEKLKTLKGVNTSICSVVEISRRIPNIKNLEIQIELMPYEDHSDLLRCFGFISILESLETLKISITNPVVRNDHVFPMTAGSLTLPRNLKKLHLSGMGFPWEYMDVIGSLPFLEVLKLRSYAFRGSQWEAQKESFLELRFLLIEDSDLVQWKPGYGSFPRLIYTSMKHCYKLQEIHGPASLYKDGGYETIEIELVDCNPLAVTCAKQIQPTETNTLNVIGSSSFDEKPITIEFQRHGGGDISEGISFVTVAPRLAPRFRRGSDDEEDSDDEDTYIEKIADRMKEVDLMIREWRRG